MQIVNLILLFFYYKIIDIRKNVWYYIGHTRNRINNRRDKKTKVKGGK